jgi:hypothetical protein
MNSGFGAIGRKIVKRIRRIAIGAFRRRGTIAVGNALCLIILFYILISQFSWRVTTPDTFVFENRQLGLFAQYLVFVIPVLLFLNSFLFRRVWQIIVSATASTIPILYLFPVLILSIAFGGFDDDGASLIRQTIAPDGEMTSLYHRKTSKMIFGEDIQYCRAFVRQRRVFPGILRNNGGREVCLPRGEAFPPDLQ